ncbi:otolin-1-like [Mercenaria mercenaria]|uniref:otolin-1-like n=1 Tax=Mercenaria mercenaria TaxID=6596 RepID=UPI00234F06DA|nr:otolin-1-like [Mercenaria mercenaria]
MDTYVFMYTLSFVVFYFINAAHPNEVHTGHNTDAAEKLDISSFNEILVQIMQLKNKLDEQGKQIVFLEGVVQEQSDRINELEKTHFADKYLTEERNESEHNNQKNLSSEIQNPVIYHDKERRMNKLESITKSKKNIVQPNLDNGEHGWLRKKRSVTNVAFSAYLSKILYPVSPGHVIKCDRVILNDGHAYNPYTGVFTVPQSGVYLLTYHLSSIKSTHIRLVLDGRVISNAMAEASAPGEEDMGGNTILIRASVGQSIWLESYHDLAGEIRSTSSYRFTTLSGYLLY